MSSVSDSRIPTRGTAIGLVIIGIASVQLGAGFAKTLFDEVSPTGLVWLRLASSALVLLALARPRVRGRDRVDWLVVLGFGASLGIMNWAFYQSFSRIPIGIAVTIEFIGPLSVAVLGSRRRRDLAWVGLAAAGVVLLGAERADLDPLGVLFALVAGGCWAAYILLSSHTGRRWEGLDGLAVASAVAVLLLTPTLAGTERDPLADPRILAFGAAVGLLCSVVPYSCELVALRRLRAAQFGVLMSLEPAAAAMAGLLVVGEQLEPLQWLAIGCVVLASIGATRTSPPPVEQTAPPPAG
ncbi:EamA family transporter [Nocardioides silvaticus]|uniref:EamA family transporter n=2 Tax=Nocardioides silvaticus TaxID=2201891 RepID=A0A316TBR4_9ACTN|nr:EamA family transporter [Nocardioides silvaticus]